MNMKRCSIALNEGQLPILGSLRFNKQKSYRRKLYLRKTKGEDHV